MLEILEETYYHNSIKEYLISFGIILLGVLIIRVFKKLILHKIKGWSSSTHNNFDDYAVSGIERFGIPSLYYCAVYLGLNYLTLSKKADHIIKISTTVVIIFLLLRLLSSTILLVLQSYVKKQEKGEDKVRQLGGLMMVINIVIWILGIVFLFDNMGYNVTAIITGLGIGGIAVALASQNILGDLFNYFVIFFDRPFEIGDFIKVDTKMGVVDYIGIKSTRIKSLTGEQLIFSNSDLANSRIHNFKILENRRIEFHIGVVYQTPTDQLKEIPKLLKSIIEHQDGTLFDRAHFSTFGDFSLNFEIAYFVKNNDYNVYMDIQQSINLKILEAFEQRKIEFAYPTQSLYLLKNQVKN